jgi:hypothetical protein
MGRGKGVLRQLESTHGTANIPCALARRGHFIVRDATGFALVSVYARTDPALRGEYLTPAEALQIAESKAIIR